MVGIKYGAILGWYDVTTFIVGKYKIMLFILSTFLHYFSIFLYIYIYYVKC